MFIYTDNEQLKKELKKLVIDSGMTQKEVAEKMEVKYWHGGRFTYLIKMPEARKPLSVPSTHLLNFGNLSSVISSVDP